jgi:hypothetical protein
MALPFAIIDRASGTIAGSTRFGNIAAEHRRVEVGWTFVGRPWQRTALNTATKLLQSPRPPAASGMPQSERLPAISREGAKQPSTNARGGCACRRGPKKTLEREADWDNSKPVG